MPKKTKSQRKTLTYAQMEGGKYTKAQRKTLTYAQMEGAGIWSDFKKWIKKHKVLSKIGNVASTIAPYTPFAAASLPLKLATKGLEMSGYGYSGGRYPQSVSMTPYRVSGKGRKPKSITKTQVKAIAAGLGYFLPSGAVSLVKAKKLYPKIKNLLPSQIKALASGYGRMMKGGGIILNNGKCSGYYKKGMGYGSGIKLPGQITGTGGRKPYKKPYVSRKKVRPVYRL